MTWTRAKRLRVYRQRRRLLVKEMGGECTYCGKKRKLEFHHTAPRRWRNCGTNRLRRLALCREEWLAGECVLACHKCNCGQGSPRDPQEEIDRLEWVAGKEGVPF